MNFGDTLDNDQHDLPYSEELSDLKTHEIDEPYLESLDDHIYSGCNT